MNAYIARGIIFDIRQSVYGFCSCRSCGPRCSRLCPSTVTTSLMLLVYLFQLVGFTVDEWVCIGQCGTNELVCDNNTCYYNDNLTRLACLNRASNSSTDNYKYNMELCVLEISCVSISSFLIFIGLLVCCQTCCKNMSFETCRVCFVCIIPSLNVVSAHL